MCAWAVVCLLALAGVVGAAYEGESCVKSSGQAGTCRNIRRCQSAVDELRDKINPTICSYVGADPIVCCTDPPATTTAAPVLTTTKRSSASSTTPYVPPLYEYVDSEDRAACEPVPASLTAPRTGELAWDKCVDYQEMLVYPCEKGVSLTAELARGDYCAHNADELIVGGTAAGENEFPHMALLGYGEDPAALAWLCGGALISDQFVLSAAHCSHSRDNGALTHVRLGVLRRDAAGGRVLRVRRVLRHPDYRPPSKYHDIALLELQDKVKLDRWTVPACLHTGGAVNDSRALATGWGATAYSGDVSDVLQKVTLTKFTHEECAEHFEEGRALRHGVDAASQMCYGDHTHSKDTCQGDSGGPLQIKNKRLNCMYTIIGVTSFGRACGFVGEPGIYTRVAHYAAWIQGTVWPQ